MINLASNDRFVLVGLVYIEEISDKSAHCQASTTYPCASGKLYYGRGPLQISW